MKPFEYPVGTRIKYISHYEDCKGKTGRIVDIITGAPLIYLPESTSVSWYSTPKRPATVQCSWYNIERIVMKNEQLVFDFALEDM